MEGPEKGSHKFSSNLKYDRMGIVTAARAVYRAGKATLVTGTILVKVIFVTIMSYRNFSGTAFYYIF
jgi:hypothetical protein